MTKNSKDEYLIRNNEAGSECSVDSCKGIKTTDILTKEQIDELNKSFTTIIEKS